MRRFWLASIVVLLVLAAQSGAQNGWRSNGIANRIGRSFRGQRGTGQIDWRTYGVANKVSPGGVWQRGYGRMGYGWYSVYGDYVGSDYSWLNYGYRNRNPSSGFNFNRVDNYGFIDPRIIGERAR